LQDLKTPVCTSVRALCFPTTTFTQKRAGATALITTEKDFVRLGGFAMAISEALPLKTVSLQVEIEHANQAVEWLMDWLKSTATQRPL